jgi:hypothetical protein
MKLIQQLMSDWVGMLSLITIVVTIGIVVYLAIFFLGRMKS